MASNLIAMFDGTWYNKKSRTNVIRMREAIASRGPNDPEQACFYDPGVGTHWYDKITGGVFGQGLSENIQQGYRWLAQKYQANDEIYVFGFSRGAYTARSLVGLIRKCGILNSADESSVARAYDLYRDKNAAPDDPKAGPFRPTDSREIPLPFIPVWATRPALALPPSH